MKMNEVLFGHERVSSEKETRILSRANTEYEAFENLVKLFLVNNKSKLFQEAEMNSISYRQHEKIIQTLQNKFPEYII